MAKKKTFRDYTALGAILSNLILKNLPFVLFLGFLTMIYIANVHYAERNVREIERLQNQIKELRWEYMSIKSELMFNTKQTEVSKKVRDLDISRLNNKPKKIIVKQKKE